jgi:hypothetical protein
MYVRVSSVPVRTCTRAQAAALAFYEDVVETIGAASVANFSSAHELDSHLRGKGYSRDASGGPLIGAAVGETGFR